jgi:hypothetical protein
MLPPRGLQGDVLSLEALDGVMETEPQSPVLESNTEPARGVTSGVFESKQGQGRDRGGFDGLADPVIALQPYYRGDEAQSDRAQIQIDDFSLQVGNPFLASSLVPPARRPLELGRLLRIAGVTILALAAATSAAWLVSRSAAATRASDARPRVAAAAIAAASPARAAELASLPEPATSQARPSSAVAPAPTVNGPVRNAATASAAPTPSVAAPVTSATRPALAAPSSQPQAANAGAAAVAVAATAHAAPAPAAVDPTVAAPASAIAVDPTAGVAASDESGALPEAPARADVVAGFEQIRDDLVKCAGGKHGIVDIDATIANSGRVAHALIDGAFRGTPEGSCIARAVRTAHFPRFSQASLKVDYPLSL